MKLFIAETYIYKLLFVCVKYFSLNQAGLRHILQYHHEFISMQCQTSSNITHFSSLISTFANVQCIILRIKLFVAVWNCISSTFPLNPRMWCVGTPIDSKPLFHWSSYVGCMHNFLSSNTSEGTELGASVPLHT